MRPAGKGERVRRFLRTVLIPIIGVLILAIVALGMAALTRRAEEKAKAELTALADAAFLRIARERQAAEPAAEAAKQNLLDKAVAVARFLAHDDALLASDALLVLCEQLNVDRIDVSDASGALLASSDTTRVGLMLTAEEAYAWTNEVLEDPAKQLTSADEATPSLVFACVPRTDIEGFVLIARNDPSVRAVLAAAGADALFDDLAVGSDLLFYADKDGADGFFYESGSLCLLKTKDGVALIAARPTADVFAERNAMLAAFGIALLCAVILGVAAYLAALSGGAETGEPADEAEPEALPPSREKPYKKRPRAAMAAQEAQEPPRKRRREAEWSAAQLMERMRALRTADEAREDAEDAGEDAADAGKESAGYGHKTGADSKEHEEGEMHPYSGPRRPDRSGGTKKRASRSAEAPVDESGFDRIVD